MNNWKEKALSSIALCVIFTGISIIYSMHMTVRAQEPDILEEPGEYGFIIEEALDEVEKDFHLEMPEKEPLEQALMLEGSVPVVETEEEEVVLEEAIFDAEEPVEEVGGLEALEEMLDAPNEFGETDEIPEALTEETLKTEIIPLLHAEASSLVERLDEMKSDDGEIIYDEDKRTLILTDTAPYVESMEAFIKEVDIPLETEVIELEQVYAKDIIGNIEAILTENIGQAVSSEEGDSLVVTDTPSQIAKIKELVATLDRFNKDILIETKTLQIVLNDEHMEGVDWEAIVSAYQGMAFPGFNDQVEGRLSLGTISQEDYEILLEALDTVGIVRTVSEYELITSNEIKIAVDVVLSAIKNFDEGDDSGRVLDQNDIAALAAAQGEKRIQFGITPSAQREGPLSISVEPQLFQGFVDKGKDRSTVIVEVKDGATIVIGSLFEDVSVSSSWKIPLLGDLPLLGFVFRNEGEVLRKTEVISFLTAKGVEKKEDSE